MKICLVAVGSRGDVQPMIALGKALQAVGHEIRIVAGSNFQDWITSYGLEAYPSLNMEAVLHSAYGLKWVETEKPLDQFKYMRILLRQENEAAMENFIEGTQGADLIIGGYVSESYLQSVHEKRGVPLISAALQPYRATPEGAASLLRITKGRSFLNFLAGKFIERMTWSVYAETTNELRIKLGLPVQSAATYLKTVYKIPALIAASPHVIPPITDGNVTVVGYWFLDEPYDPPAELMRFLDSGEPPIYVGFGSMPSSDPQATFKIISDALSSAGVRAIIATGWGAAHPTELPSNIYVLNNAPHSWLFPRTRAIVHHGGAGTTAAALRAGKPMLIIPHMADQPFWGQRVYDLKVGLKPIPRLKLTSEALAAGIRELATNQQLQANAEKLGQQIRAENGIDVAVQWIQRFIQQQMAATK